MRFQLVKRSVGLRPTLFGWLFLVGIFIVLVLIMGMQLGSIMAKDDPVNASILILEGWMNDDELKQVVNRIDMRQITVLTTGMALRKGSMFSSYETSAEFTRARLIHLGISQEKIQAVPAKSEVRDRTWHTAMTVRQWFLDHGSLPKSVNIVTIGLHARRSRMIYQKVLGSLVKVGVFAIPNTSFSTKYWWRTSAGLSSMIKELIGYIYVQFFYPTN